MILITIALSALHVLAASTAITPYKPDINTLLGAVEYTIPASARFTISRPESSSEIVYYLSAPQTDKTYPIALLCGGSSLKNSVCSIIHFHRHFLQEFSDLGAAVLTVEQQGVDGNAIDVQEFMDHYTRSARLADHRAIITHLKNHPPAGWNGKLILLGASEGGPLVTTLTAEYGDMLLATINLCGAGDWSWRDELWAFIETMRSRGPWYMKLWDLVPRWLPFSLDLPRDRASYDERMNAICACGSTRKYLMGMTCAYHADAMRYPTYTYDKINTPFLVVAGAQDSIIASSDMFVEKARAAGAPITYFRVDDMDHFVRRRPEIVEQVFVWLKGVLVQGQITL